MAFRMKNRRVKRQKRIFFFVNSTEKTNIFYTVVCTIAIKLFTKNYKKFIKKRFMKKTVYVFLIKKHLYLLDRAQNNKIFSNCQATYQKELCLLFEKLGNCFHRANEQIHLIPPPSVSFSSLFQDPPSPRTMLFMNAPSTYRFSKKNVKYPQ